MSAAKSRTQSEASRRSRRTSASPARRRDTRRAPPARTCIDDGPALTAIDDLAVWALDVAETSTRDWPDARRRVRAVRAHLERRARGERSTVADEDVAFVASLLVRILDEDLCIGLADIAATMAGLGISTAALDLPFGASGVTKPGVPDRAWVIGRRPRRTPGERVVAQPNRR